MNNLSDVELMNQIKKGEQEAFVSLVRRYQQPLLNFFIRLNANNTDAEDLVQETFLKLFNYRFRYERTAKFTTFLYTLAYHSWVDYKRKCGKVLTIESEIQSDEHSVVDCNTPIHTKINLKDALAKLSEEHRTVIVMSIYSELKHQEIAEILGVPLGTVKSRIHFALKQLREILSYEPITTRNGK
ncbi:MAG: RNA polymerase sigma factor [Planctomycetota bacterium]|nr:RNA polymerase sigma factor [Planctomycetota bacterium]